MTYQINPGSVDQTIYFRLRDSTTGLPKTGLLFNTAGALCYYTRPRAAATAITLATLASPTAAHADGGFIEVQATNAKGLYRLDLPDAVVATGADYVIISIDFDGIIEEALYIDLRNRPIVSDIPTAAQNRTEMDSNSADLNTIIAYVDELETRLTAVRAGYLDNLSAGAVALQTSVDDLEGRLTAVRAGYLDNLSAGAVALQTSVDDLEGRLTAGRATLLDNLSNLDAAISTRATPAQVKTQADTALTDINLDHLIKIAVDTNFPTTTHTDSVIGHMVQTADAGYDRSTDSLEAIRDRGDVAWITGGGGSISDILHVLPVMPIVDRAATKTFRFGLLLINSVDDLPSTAEITPGTISIEKAAIGATAWTAVVTDQAMSEAAGIIYYDATFPSASYSEGDSLRITLKGQKITVSANDYEICPSGGHFFYSFIRQNALGTTAGAIEVTWTITTSGATPVEGAACWISRDTIGADIVWAGVTDALGIARATNNNKPWLDTGTYYGWVQKVNYDPPTLPITLVVS